MMLKIASGLVLAAMIFGCCTKPAGSNPDRLSFFENDDRAIFVPVTIEGGAVANAFFDTGASSTWVQLDSTFCAVHPLPAWGDHVAEKIDRPSYIYGWAEQDDKKVNQTIYYNTPLTINMCGVDLEFDKFYVIDNSVRLAHFDACFSFSAKDTTHIWELNFEHNYMEAHSVGNYTMPKGCYVFPIIKHGQYPVCVQFPVEVKCRDGAAITINQTYFIDTGMLLDMVLFDSAQEYDFFNRRDDAVLIAATPNNRRYDVDGKVFGKVKLDGMRIYLNNSSFLLNDKKEVCGAIGLNFLKRFNVYFDLSTNQIGFLPIKGFKRTVNMDFGKLYISTELTAEGYVLITKVWDFHSNSYKDAGVMAGDVIVATNGIDIKEITPEEWKSIKRSKTRTLDILRNGVPMKMSVHFSELGE